MEHAEASEAGGSMADFDEILMEAGYTQADAANVASTSRLAASQSSLAKRPRISSCCSGSSVSDGSFLTATQQQQDQELSSASFSSSSSDDQDSDCEQQHHHHRDSSSSSSDLEAQLATPAPEHVCGGHQCCPENFENEYDEDDNNNNNDLKLPAAQASLEQPAAVPDNYHHHLHRTMGRSKDHHTNVPIIPLTSLQLLEEKKQIAIIEEQEQPDTMEDALTTSTTGNDQESVASAQSLVSVVAELVAYPIKVFAAVMADLNTELIASMGTHNIPSRAEFISATILLKEAAETYDELGLTLERQLNRTSGNQVLVVAEIDPEGHWRGSPLRVGDRIISINHTNVSQWEVEELHSFWKNLLLDNNGGGNNNICSSASTGSTTSVETITLVAHNPTGEGQWVAAMVTKPGPSIRTGLGMRSSRPGRVKISRVGGLFSDSLLNPGDQILSINGLGVHGYNSADTANEILQSPKYVTVLAKADSRGAFVIATTDREASTRSLLLAAEQEESVDEEFANEDDEYDEEAARRQERRIKERCDNCGCLRGHWTTLRTLHWAGTIYVLFLTALGIYVCVDNQLNLSMVMAVMVMSVVLLNMVFMTTRSMKRRQMDPYGSLHPSRYSIYQLSSNIILLAAFSFLLIMWRSLGYTAVTSEFILAVVILVLAPMLVFVNMPSCCVLPPEFPLAPAAEEEPREASQQDDDEEEEDYFEDESGDEVPLAEPEAVASLEATP
ncbi:expressed unknown protein [Seminavis robusta]|uniref:PDZ domain-containing protein n=1 Tax=Seminavis robusta TaxID=568900 RepID=A0A9N8EXG7_9STRA|nr:expressed unknown protein [Seminavis robusta]|eukprot:Sro2159_g317000.1 n/a (728) ;mRNA; f:4438-6621